MNKTNDSSKTWDTNYFDHVWSDCEKQGSCDGLGGSEYRRVRSEWIRSGKPRCIKEFIGWRANIGPYDNFSETVIQFLVKESQAACMLHDT